MATNSRRSDTVVADEIRNNVTAFDLDQLIKLLLSDDEQNSQDICDRIDRLFSVSSHVRYDLPPKAISWYGEEGPVAQSGSNKMSTKLALNYFGIAAFNSPLPQPYVEWIFRELNDGLRKKGKSPILDFLDIFNHRALAIQHQNRAEQRISLSSQHPNHADVAKRIESISGFYDVGMFDLIDISMQARESEGTELDKSKRNDKKNVERHLVQTFSGLLYNPRKSIEFVKAILSTVFDEKVEVQQFLGHWLPLEKEDRNRLGVKNTSLGGNVVLGKECWDQQSLMGITLGPLGYNKFLDLMPQGKLHDSLLSLIRFLSDGDWDCKVRLMLAEPDIPFCNLVSFSPETRVEGRLLGRNSWLKYKEYTKVMNRVRLGVNSWLSVENTFPGYSEFKVSI